MKNISDEELVGEINRRLDEYNRTLHDLKILTEKLETVNAKLQESEATKSDFLSNIRNEINNPLTSIMGLSKHLQDGTHNKDELKSITQSIYNEAFDLDFQLSNIFIAAEIEAGESPVGIANVEVERFFKRIIKSFSHKTEEKGLDVVFLCEGGDSLAMKTDPLKLHAILMNLFSNAVEFSHEGMTIKVKIEPVDEGLAFSIEDQGTGIANEARESIYDRFRQLGTGSRKEHHGHGLGLSIVRSLLNQLGGTINFSGKPGEGCTFSVTVPEFEAESEVDVYSENGNEFIFGTEEEF